jgi:hypothetical protein
MTKLLAASAAAFLAFAPGAVLAQPVDPATAPGAATPVPPTGIDAVLVGGGITATTAAAIGIGTLVVIGAIAGGGGGGESGTTPSTPTTPTTTN